METLVTILAVLCSILGLVLLRAAGIVWFFTVALIVAALTFTGQLQSCLAFGVAGSLLALIGGLSCPWLRRPFFTRWVYRWFKSALPPMSETEQAAIESGDVWWEAQLFRGSPNWKELLDYPKPALTREEQDFLDKQVEMLCSLLDDWTITHEQMDLPKNVWTYIKEQRFFGMQIPKSYGGLGFSALANSTIVQKIASRSLSAAVTVMVPNSLGPGELLTHYGTEAQKQLYLPKLAVGAEVPCFALTGIDAGSDATAISDTGVVCLGNYQGKEVLGMRLNWNKRYITLAPVATVLGLAFKLYDPDGLLGTQKELGITVCLLPTTLPGVEVGKRHFPMNQAFMNGPTRGKDVFVPLDCIIGGQANVGQGWKMLMECLAAGRGISLPALSSAAGKHAYRMTGAYAKIRKQFNVAIGEFEGVGEAMARIGGYTYLLEATRLLTLTGIDLGMKPAVVTAISKYHMTEFGRQAITDAMDVHAGRGIILGRRNYLGRAYQGIPISITVEGANILTRSLIIFGQGAVRCHPYVVKEISAAHQKDPKVGLKAFDQVIFEHVAFTASNVAKLLFHTLTGRCLFKTPLGKGLRKYYCQLSFMSLGLAVVSDVAMMTLGGKLKRKERLSARLGDVLSYLYMASAVLKYHHDFEYAATDQPYVQWCLKTCLHRADQAMRSFLENYPHRMIAWKLHCLLFLWGRRAPAPSDDLDLEISRSMMQPSLFRDRLTTGYHQNTSPHDVTGRMEHALKMLWVSEPSLKKIEASIKQGILPKQADMASKIRMAQEKGIITPEEAVRLRDFEQARLDAIQVDEFTSEQLIGKT